MSTPRNPMQPLVVVNQVVRFKENAIVRHLYDRSKARGEGLNELALRDFSQDDWEQFNQLLGYSLTGFHELSMVSDETALAASAAAKKLGPNVRGCRDDGCEIHTGVERKP